MVSLVHPLPRNRLRRHTCHPKSGLPRRAKAGSGLRYYSPELGRWTRRDPIEEAGGLNPSVAFNNGPLDSIDGFGLWGKSVHRDKTVEWAHYELSMPKSGAKRIGKADNDVDSKWPPTTISDSTWQYHFNRSTGVDSRLLLSSSWQYVAEWMCDWTHGGNDDWKKAGTWMGYSLHPLQDWVAHGDYNNKATMPNPSAWPTWTTGFSKFDLIHNNNAGYSGDTKDPDDETKDALQGPSWTTVAINGRPIISGMKVGKTWPGAGTTYWAKYTGGTLRIGLTESLTEQRLGQFMDYVDQWAKPCGKCRKYFLPE